MRTDFRDQLCELCVRHVEVHEVEHITDLIICHELASMAKACLDLLPLLLQLTFNVNHKGLLVHHEVIEAKVFPTLGRTRPSSPAAKNHRRHRD
eukprot:COSAG02_NODE_506_length_20931_cov_20.533218_7_plen_94_part_00